MDLLQAIILGIVQGITEFLPVSSKTHLILVPWLLGWPIPSLEFNVIIQLGTLASVLIYFWRDWLRVLGGGLKLLQTRSLEDRDSRLFVFLIIGSIPVGLVGLFLKDLFEQIYQNPAVAAALLLVTAGILFAAERFSRPTRNMDQMTWIDALVVGLGQVVALLPGISRSGSTIAAGMFRGIQRDDAARFSFLLSTPAFLGAGLLSVLEVLSAGNLENSLPFLAVGFISAAVVGYFAIAFLLAYLRRRPLYVFAVYCAAVGLFGLAVALITGR